MTTKTTIHVVDDDASFRASMSELLSACGYNVTVYRSARELLGANIGKERACILLDVRMAEVSGPQLQDRLAADGCNLPIVFISGHGDIPTTVRAIKAGAEDFLTKPVSKDRLLGAIDRALLRYDEKRDEVASLETMRSHIAALTPREKEVFTLLVQGKPHKQIAFTLGVSERMIKMHRHNVTDKLQVRSLAELAVIAERLGLFREPKRPD